MTARQRNRTRLERERGAARARARDHYARVRRRRATRAQRRAVGALAFAGAFALGVVAGGADVPFWAALDPSASVAQVSVFGHERVDAREIAGRAGIESDVPAAALDLAAAGERVRSHPWVRAARVRPAGDRELLVIVEEREPAAVLHAQATDSFWAVEADGTPFAQVAATSFPRLLRLRAGSQLRRGEPQSIVAEALALADRIEAHGIPRPEALALPDEGDTAALGWRFTLAGSGPEVVLGRTPPDERLARLAALLAARPAAVRSAERIDMRFRDRAILRTADTIPAPEARPSPSRGASAACSARDWENGPPRDETGHQSAVARGCATPPTARVTVDSVTSIKMGGTGKWHVMKA